MHRRQIGYTAVLNGRFKGGWTTRHYGRPAEGLHAIQMELAQSTYMIESRALDLSAGPRQGDCARILKPILTDLTRMEARMSDPRHNIRDVFPATGTEITAKSWLTEAPMRMLMNNLHPDVAENPHELVVYGGIGRAARTWDDFDPIVAVVEDLEADETLLVQSGKPVGVFKTHEDAPRVLIANSNLVPHWANWDHFNELDKSGLAMYGQMTAGSWIYIGTQGIVQGTYETFVEAGRQHYGGDLTGKWILTGGLGGMGGAQPLAAVMAGACCLAVECNPDSIDFRLRTRYLDEKAETLDEALAMIDRWTKAGEAKSVGLLGNAADVFPELVKRMGGRHPPRHRDRPDIAHDPLNGYLPQGLEHGRMARQARKRPQSGGKGRPRQHESACRRDGRFLECGCADTGLRQQHPAGRAGRRAGKRLCLSGLRARLYPPAVLSRDRAVPLVRAVGRSRRHLQDRRQGEGTDPRRSAPAQMAGHGARAHQLSGPARAHLLGRSGRCATNWALPSTKWCAAAN